MRRSTRERQGMSSLIFYADQKQALVATDTLAVSRESREPAYFTSRAIYVPHLKTIVTSTGADRFMEQWFSVINQLPVNDIHELNSQSPENLARLFDWFNSVNAYEHPEPVTVYHIGFSEKDDMIYAFAYSYSDGFRPQPLAYGLAILPPCAPPEGNFTFIEDVPGLMVKQREEQEKVEPGKRIPIGGEIYGMYLSAEGCNSFKLGVFDDYPADRETIDLKQSG